MLTDESKFVIWLACALSKRQTMLSAHASLWLRHPTGDEGRRSMVDDRSLPYLALSGAMGLVFLPSAASLVLRLWNGSALGPSVTGDERLSEILWWAVLIPALVPAYATLGAVVASRRPRNGVGWLCLAFGTLVAAEDLSWQYAARTLKVDPGSPPWKG